MWLFIVVCLCLLVAYVTSRQRVPEVVAPTTGVFDMYVVNLDRAQARMRRFVHHLQATDLADVPLIRLRAVDGNNLDLKEHVTEQALREIKLAERVGYRQRHYELTRGAVGCYLSHMDAWTRLLTSDKDVIMVCEDDAVLDRDIGRKVMVSLETLPAGWDVLLLGYWCVKCDRQQGFRKMHRFFGLHCYLINRGAVAKIKAYAGTRVSQQVDSMLSDMCSEGRLEVYGVDEKAAVQSGSSSTVQIPLRAGRDVDPWAALPVVRAMRSLTTA